MAQLVNTSVRTRVGAGADILIAGFVVGNTPKTFLLRAGGPALRGFGLTDVLNDPVLKLYAGPNLVQTNDNWSDGTAAAAIAQSAASAGAFAYTAGSKDAALIATLSPGAYTVQISGADGGAGTALFEAYEIATPAANAVLRGLVRDGITRNGLAGVTLTFTGPTGSAAGSVLTSATGEYSITLPGGAVTASVSFNGYVTTTLNATTTANTTLQADAVLFAQNIAGNGTITGRLTHALTGAGVSGATLRFRTGVQSTTGTVVASALTDGSGNYTILALSGTYTVEITLINYVTTYFTCVAVGGRTIAQQNPTISPQLTSGSLRIILTWGEQPYDLDSHLTGPSGSSRFHVYWLDRDATGVNLDRDDQFSEGPETITILQFAPGLYRYSVHDFSNGSASNSTALSNISGAKVRVLQGSTEIAAFNVPSGRVGNLWTVFELDGATRTITAVNSVSNISDYRAVPSLRAGVTSALLDASTDADLIARSPAKK